MLSAFVGRCDFSGTILAKCPDLRHRRESCSVTCCRHHLGYGFIAAGPEGIHRRKHLNLQHGFSGHFLHIVYRSFRIYPANLRVGCKIMLLSGDGKGFRIDIVILFQRYGYLGSPDLGLLLSIKENLTLAAFIFGYGNDSRIFIIDLHRRIQKFAAI